MRNVAGPGLRLDRAVERALDEAINPQDRARFEAIAAAIAPVRPSAYPAMAGLQHRLLDYLMPTLADVRQLTIERQHAVLEAIAADLAATDMASVCGAGRLAVARELKLLARLRAGINSVVGEGAP